MFAVALLVASLLSIQADSSPNLGACLASGPSSSSSCPLSFNSYQKLWNVSFQHNASYAEPLQSIDVQVFSPIDLCAACVTASITLKGETGEQVISTQSYNSTTNGSSQSFNYSLSAKFESSVLTATGCKSRSASNNYSAISCKVVVSLKQTVTTSNYTFELVTYVQELQNKTAVSFTRTPRGYCLNNTNLCDFSKSQISAAGASPISVCTNANCFDTYNPKRGPISVYDSQIYLFQNVSAFLTNPNATVNITRQLILASSPNFEYVDDLTNDTAMLPGKSGIIYRLPPITRKGTVTISLISTIKVNGSSLINQTQFMNLNVDFNNYYYGYSGYGFSSWRESSDGLSTTELVLAIVLPVIGIIVIVIIIYCCLKKCRANPDQEATTPSESEGNPSAKENELKRKSSMMSSSSGSSLTSKPSQGDLEKVINENPNPKSVWTDVVTQKDINLFTPSSTNY